MSELKRVLADRGISVGVKGTKERRISGKLAADLFGARPEEQAQILTRHGAHLVFRSVKEAHTSYKALGAYLYQQAENMVSEAEARHQAEIKALTARIGELERKQLPEPVAANGGTEAQETAGN